MDIKRLVELNIIDQVIKDGHEIKLSTEVDSDAGVQTREVIIERESYNLLLNISYYVVGELTKETIERPSEDNRELSEVSIDEISLCPANSDIEIELGQLEASVIKSITFTS